MDKILGQDLWRRLGDAEAAIQGPLGELLDPWVLIQLTIILAALLAGILLGRQIELRLEPRVRSVQGRPRLLRFLALLLRRTKWIVSLAIMLGAVVILRAGTRPSHGALIGAAAWLIAAWIAISVGSRLIRNRVLSRLVAWVAWIFVALRITGASDEVAAALDRLAFRFGAFNVSLYDVIQATLVISVAITAAVAVGNFLAHRVAATQDLTPSLKVLIGKILKIVLLVAAGGIALTALGIDLTALTVFSGALGVGIGFGLQKVVSNFVSGIIILLDKSIKPGDTISLGETFGWIRSLRARFVSVVTRDGREYLIPNEDFITQRVENWSFTDTLIRVDVEFGVSQQSDPHAVRRIAVEATKAVARVEPRPQPVCHMTRITELSLDFILRFWISDPQNGMTNIRGAVLLASWDALKAAGIEFPFPLREIILRQPVEVRLEGGPAARRPD